MNRMYYTENIGKHFTFTNGFPVFESVIIEEFTHRNETLGTEHIFKVFYINDGNPRIRYVPKSDINISKIDAEITSNEIELRKQFKWSLLDIEDYWYNFCNYNGLKI